MSQAPHHPRQAFASPVALLQLKILSWRGDELASDVLPIAGLERGTGVDAAASLATYYPLSKDRTVSMNGIGFLIVLL